MAEGFLPIYSAPEVVWNFRWSDLILRILFWCGTLPALPIWWRARSFVLFQSNRELNSRADGWTDRLLVCFAMHVTCQLGSGLEQVLCDISRKAASDTSTFYDLDVSVFTKFMSPFIKGKGAKQFCFKIKHNLDVSDIDWILLQKILFFHLGISCRFFVKPYLSVSTCFGPG